MASVSQPIQQFYYFPLQITNGCIQKFFQLDNYQDQKFSEGYSEGLIIVVIIALAVLAVIWLTSNSG